MRSDSKQSDGEHSDGEQSSDGMGGMDLYDILVTIAFHFLSFL